MSSGTVKVRRKSYWFSRHNRRWLLLEVLVALPGEPEVLQALAVVYLYLLQQIVVAALVPVVV
jgi:hypothetical protein